MMASEPIVPDEPTSRKGNLAVGDSFVKDVSDDSGSPSPNKPVAKNMGETIAAQQASVNDASSRAAGLWISFLTFAAYLTVTVGSVTHEMMLRDAPIRLPVLNVDLPIFAFFVIVPFFFVLFHFYLYLQLVILARKISTYNDVLRVNVTDHGERQLHRRRLDTFLFVQLLCGAEQERKGLTAWLLRLVAWLTLVGVPVALLLQFQLAFLPFHSSIATWTHRVMVVADLALVWAFWFAVNQDKGEFHVPPFLNHWAASGLSILVLLLSGLAMAYYGETPHRYVKIYFCSEAWRPISDCIFHGPVNMVKGRPRAPFSNVLVVPYKNLVDDDDVEKGKITLSLRGRDLRGAVLIQADLRRADFTGANLNDARLDRVRAAGAVFGREDPGGEHPTEWPADGCTWLRGASLAGANLEGAEFINAHLQGAMLIEAKLHGANFTNAHLQSAVLTKADLTAATLTKAQLQGAYLVQTNFSGATLDEANLQHALLELARFEFASVGNQGKVEVFGTVGFPNLSFASFKLSKETKQGDSFKQFVDIRDAMLKTLLVEDSRRNENGEVIQLSAQNIEELTRKDPSDPLREPAQFPWRIFVPGYYRAFYDNQHDTDWAAVKGLVETKWSEAAPDEKDKTSFLAKNLSLLACEGGHAPHLARGLIQNGLFLRAGPHLEQIMDKFKKKECEGAAGFKLFDYEVLYALKSTPDVADTFEIPSEAVKAAAH